MRSRDVIEFLGFPDCSSGLFQKVLCEVIQGNIGRIGDLIDVLGRPHLYKVFYQEIYIE